MWTLQYIPYTGSPVEQSFADWGIVETLPYAFASQAKSLLDILTNDDFDDAFQLSPCQVVGGEFQLNKVIIWRDRTAVDSGGTIFFQGYVAEPRRLATGAKQNHRYTLYDWWWLAEMTPFRRIRKHFTGDHTVFVTVPPTELVLYENQNEQLTDTGVQWAELVNFLNEAWNPTRRGATSGINPALDVVTEGYTDTDLQVPRYPIRDQTVAECLRMVAAWTQDAAVQTDYTASPPIVSIMRAGMSPSVLVTLPADNATALQLKPRYDLQIPGVIIYYSKSYTFDGVTGRRFYSDKYPPTISDFHPNARVHTVDLLGQTVNTLSALVTSEVIDAANADTATQKAWWKKFVPWLADTKVSNSSIVIEDVLCYDRDGVLLNTAAALAYTPNKTDSQIAAWMDEVAQYLTFTANITYTVQGLKADGTLGANVPNHTQKKRLAIVKLLATSAGPGVDIPYTTVAHNDPGEPVPNGLAQALYESHATLQHEGTVSLVGADVRGDMGLGTLLDVTTPGGSYTGMLVQSVAGELTRGLTEVTVGPPGHLGFADIIELYRVNRYRTVFNLPSNASNPVAVQGADIEFAKDAPKENTSDGSTTYEAFSVSANA